MTPDVNVLVIGAGAIGTYIGGSLALAGNRVTFLEQPASARLLRKQGLRMELQGTLQVLSAREGKLRFSDSLRDALKGEQFDFGIYALKTFDTSAFLDSLGADAARMPPVLCLSNGVEQEAALAAFLGAERVIAGTVTSSIARRGPGDIVLERSRGIGLFGGHPLSTTIQQALQAAGLNARLFPCAADMKWSKMLTNLPANATAAILDMNASEVYSHPGVFQLEMHMLREALAVMRAHGIRVIDLPGTPVRLLALGIRLPAAFSLPLLRKAVGGGRGGKMPSFHIDLHSGRGKSEVDWLNGAVVRHGHQKKIPTPVNQALNFTLQNLTSGDIELTEFSRQPDRFLKIIHISEGKR
jgi:2-dehydropantoate 2-reductase